MEIPERLHLRWGTVFPWGLLSTSTYFFYIIALGISHTLHHILL